MSQSKTDLRAALPDEPMTTLAAWIAEAQESARTPNPTAMTLATVGEQRGDMLPSARIVLCKHIETRAGFVVFFTNYRSRKAAEIERCANAAAVFHWDHFGRQARIEGRIELSPAAESDAYFASRPRGSQLGAWASAQSEPVASRAALAAQFEKTRERFAADADIPRPPNWGGYRLWASAVELWAHGDDRLHDRARWIRTVAVDGNGAVYPHPWTVTRLQP